MKALKKVISISLATVMTMANIVPVFAEAISDRLPLVPSQDEAQVELKILKKTDSLDKNREILTKEIIPKEDFSKENLSPTLTTAKTSSNNQEKATYKNLRVKIEFYGIDEKDFDFDEVLPKDSELEFIYKNPKTKQVETISRSLTRNRPILDFGKIPQEAIENGVLRLKRDPDDKAKLIEVYSLGELESQDFLLYKIYQVQSTKLSVRTITSDGRPTANPTDLTFTYRLLDKVKKGRIPFDSEETDVLEDDLYTFDLEDGENIYDGREKPELSLDMAKNGYVANGDFAYKILKQEQKDEKDEVDRSKPLEVTLIKKAKLIKSVSQPTYTDPDTGEEIPDDDYVRMADKNAKNADNRTDLWLLKTDGDLISDENDGEEEKTESKSGFLANDISICAGDEIFTDILLKNPSESKSPILKAILKKDDLENNKLIFGENGEIEVEIIDYSYLEDINSYSVSLRVAVDPSYGNEVRKSPQILRDDADPLNPVPYINQSYQISLVDENGNAYAFENQIIIKNQNTKADLIPAKIKVNKGGILAETKQMIRPQDIINQVKNGRWQNKKSANERYANKTMAIKKAPSFAMNSAQPKLAADPFSIDYDKFEEIDWNEPGGHQVPVTVAWIDGSTSRVNVPVEVLANDIVLTGIFDTDYTIGLMLVGLGLVAGAITLYNLNRKKAYI